LANIQSNDIIILCDLKFNIKEGSDSMKKIILFVSIITICTGLSAFQNNSKEKSTTGNVIKESSDILANEGQEIYEEKTDRLKSIVQEEFEKKIAKKETFWIYIGRPNCPDCQKFYPKLSDYLENNNLTLLYFNTKVKVSEKEAMVLFLNDLGIDEIPAILKINQGKVIKVFDMQKEEDIKKFEVEYKQ
jgi:predicted bacteriocin transport accessory protein